MYALTGSHRSGKSTTAQDVAERLGLDYFDGSFGKLARELGYNSVDAMSASDRIVMQERCLVAHVEKIAALPRPCITDRCPLDFASYAIAEVAMHNDLSPEISGRIARYAEDCIEATKLHYGAVVLLAPLASYEIADGKPPACIAFQSHIQLLIEGLTYRCRGRITIGRTTSFDREERATQVAGLIADELLLAEEQRGENGVH